MSIQNSNDITGNRIRDLPAFSRMPQSTAQPCSRRVRCAQGIKNLSTILQAGLTAERGRVMTQAASRRPVTAEAQVLLRHRYCQVCFGINGTGTGFLRVGWFSTVRMIPSVLDTQLHLYAAATRKIG
jgi:hypothetical protein